MVESLGFSVAYRDAVWYGPFMIKPDLKPLLDLLNGDFQLIVPSYQRPYAWKSEEVSELLEDLQGYVGKSQGLYLGSIILDVSREDDKKVEIVDGQQRLTTLFLLLIACRDHARSISAMQQAEKTQSRITFTGAILNETIGMKLVASDSIRNIFECMASSDWDGKFPEHGHKLQVRKLKPLYSSFRKHLSRMDASQLAQFQSAILAIRVMRIDIDAKEEAFSIFERTNARGLDLEFRT
ncbi:MAG TPA: DUF262 domain-containing protein [Edaphobacter sp.]|nr:DUF262 domain-containing protein [Edaphobacter sp.]